MREALVLALALLVACAPAAPPLTAPGLPPGELDGLEGGKPIRVQVDGSIYTGVLASHDSLGFQLLSDSGVKSIQSSRVTALWTGSPATARGALIGLVIGALPVALTCGQTLHECGLFPQGFVIAALGVGLGTLIGSSLNSWRLAWPR